jgi:integrase
LTGARRSEAAECTWSEFHLDGPEPTWIIPAARFKSDRQHRIPLSPQALTLMRGLPRHRGPFVFSTTLGVRPLGDFSGAKHLIDKVMAEEMEAAPERWTLHDLRRSVRSRLSQLRIPSEVRDMVLGHAKRGMDRIYDQWEFEPEKREALVKWADRLTEIVTPPDTDNVTQLRGKPA